MKVPISYYVSATKEAFGRILLPLSRIKRNAADAHMSELMRQDRARLEDMHRAAKRKVQDDCPHKQWFGRPSTAIFNDGTQDRSICVKCQKILPPDYTYHPVQAFVPDTWLMDTEYKEDWPVYEDIMEPAHANA